MNKLFASKIGLISITLLLGLILGWMFHSLSLSSSDSHDHESSEGGEPTLWTCSMDPQVKLNAPGSCPICGMDLIPLAQGTTESGNPNAIQMTKEAIAMAAVQTQVVGGTSTGKELLLTGKLQADERENASITAKFPGRIEKLFVTFTGEQIRAGQKLATIYSPELITAQKEFLEALKTKGSYPQLYKASKEKLTSWKLTTAQIAEIERAGVVKEKWDILSDQSGIVLQKNVSLGDYIGTGSVLFTVTDLTKLWLRLDVYETDLPFVSLGDNIQFTVAGRPSETKQAQVSFIDPLIDPTTRAASLRAEISNGGMVLKPEMFVTAKISAGKSTATTDLVVPRTAILWTGKRSVVYVKVPKAEVPSFEMREVTLGNRLGENYQITAGLEAGEEIVSQGAFAVDASAQLSGKPSLLNRSNAQQVEVSAAFSQEITAVVAAYFQVKNSLVKDQMPTAASQILAQSLAKVSSAAGTGKDKDKWKKIEAELSQATAKLKTAKDISAARTHFSSLSSAIIQLAENYQLPQKVVYQDYCPMAFNNKGAYWLSETEDIKNPYFGASMLSCGEVKKAYPTNLPNLIP
ncbi:MAG: efflux RND transporter periplasmic adaptor subunit [Algoriphagus sp.]|nr:efflux RND transporter periplasmic adaptor subunit [Algoriphagus sp.]